jgi:predicted enzyme related to lactoylglutathione lyase
VSRIAQIVIPVTDLAAASSFYAEVLGLKTLFEAPNVRAFDAGGLRLLLTLRPDWVAPAEAGILLYFDASDIAARHRDLLARGAADAGAPHRVATLASTEVWIAFIRDPFGTTLGLIEEVPIRTG